jgi:toxin CcdB
MPQHDVYRTACGEYLLDCQSDALDDFNTRFVVPLIDPNNAPKVAHRLNPRFTVKGKELVMYTQFASSVHVDDLKDYVGSLDQHRHAIITALDTLIGTY